MIAGWVAKITPEAPSKTYVPPTPEEHRVLALERVKQAASVHHGAVETAIQWEGRQTPYHIVDAVLTAGSTLDGVLRHALDAGVTVEELSAVAKLHHLYLETIEAETGGASATWV